ncbi:MAG TPA: hypothetical protein VI689_04445 [Acidimicrobiia bacterium]|nr:hypothetical protein [Acidimicrobiia bacterium]
MAFSANAANMTVDGGVLQAFRVEAGPHRRVEPGLTTPPDTVVMIAIQSVPATSTTTTVATAP